MIRFISNRRMAAAKTLAAILFALLSGLMVRAQALSVIPVNVFFSPGQKATSLTITNQGTSETAVQLRAFAWNQKDNNDQLAASDALLISPPIAKIGPGATQVIRLILRQALQDRETTQRIVIDQIPPPAEAGVVHMVLRLSIPVFAKPLARAFPDVQFHLESDGGQNYLVGFNAGLIHEKIRDIVLTTSDGRKLKAEAGTSPYVLSNATRRWHLTAQDSLPLTSETLQLTAQSDAGAINEQVRFVAAR